MAEAKAWGQRRNLNFLPFHQHQLLLTYQSPFLTQTIKKAAAHENVANWVPRAKSDLLYPPTTQTSTMSGLLPKIDRSKTVKSKDYRGSSSFATFMIVGRE